MRLRSDLFMPLLAMLIFLAQATAADAGDNKFNLKKGARGKNCLTCHDSFAGILKKPFIHTPLQDWDCTGCHNPHAAKHGKILDADAKDICLTCHDGIFPAEPVSTHTVAMEGTCVKCHDPHAARYEYNLHFSGKDLCFDCHQEMADKVAAAKYKHMPVQEGCLDCHNPHGSAAARSLLQARVPGLCLGCHDSSKKLFQKQHGGFAMETARCTSCHDPHGSGQKGLLYDQLHVPFGKKMCKRCHENTTAAEPFKTKTDGYKLCLGCHSNMVNSSLNKNKVHWPLLDGEGCLNCHNPHASAQEALLKKPATEVCGQCHSDTVQRMETVEHKHSPVTEGMCTSCHDPHASDQTLLLNQDSLIKICAECHDWQEHSSHPIGSDYTDPRNQNLRVNCLSCHRSHGTPNERMMLAPKQTEMCTTCHSAFRR